MTLHPTSVHPRAVHSLTQAPPTFDNQMGKFVGVTENAYWIWYRVIYGLSETFQVWEALLPYVCVRYR